MKCRMRSPNASFKGMIACLREVHALRDEGRRIMSCNNV